MKKIPMIAAAAAGYVLGTRAGRDRYEQIKSQADRLWKKPQVQSAVDDATSYAKSTASDLGGKAADAAGQAKHAASDKLSSDKEGESAPSTSSSSPSGSAADATAAAADPAPTGMPVDPLVSDIPASPSATARPSDQP